MTENSSYSSNGPKFRDVLREDFRRDDLKRTIKRDYRELKEYFIDEQRKKRLQGMGWFSKWILTWWWLFKALFLKLSPAREVLLLIGCILIIFSRTVQFEGEQVRVTSDTNMIGGIIVLFVLMLELKDKLLAHDELESGRAIQSALMPDRSPSVAGWSLWLYGRTANEVGGNMVDFQTVGPDRYGIALADVAGKGLRAALLMAKLQSTIRALTPESDSITALGKKINRIFYRDGVRNIFASLVYLELQANSGTLRLINAGHLPPILIRENALEELHKGDPAIGIFPETDYHEERLEVKPGEIVLIYSDGLTDAKNEAGEFYGTQRLQKFFPKLSTLTAPEMGEQLVKEIDRFVGEARVFDDLSLVILKRMG